MDREDAIPPSAGSGRAPRLPRVLGRKQGAPQEERQRTRANEAPEGLGRWLREPIKLLFVSQAILANPYRMQVPPARYWP